MFNPHDEFFNCFLAVLYGNYEITDDLDYKDIEGMTHQLIARTREYEVI